MKRNIFGEPRPADYDELIEAIDEKGINPTQSVAFVEEESSGWSAELLDGEADASITTVAWSSLEELKQQLEAVGCQDIEVIRA